MDCLPIPRFCLDFLLRSKGYLKERPPSAQALQIGIFQVCGEAGLQTLQGANYAAAQWFTLVQGA